MNPLLLRITGAVLGCIGAGTLIGSGLIVNIVKLSGGELIQWKVWLSFGIGMGLIGAGIALWYLARRIEAWAKFEEFVGEFGSGEGAPFPRRQEILDYD